jgi:adenylylsulfate kinase-like enzyme
MSAPVKSSAYDELEKQGTEVNHVDDNGKLGSDSGLSEDFGFTEQEQKRIIRRIDRRLVVTVGAMYCVSLMDRTNMSAANIAGMAKELTLTGFRYVS